MATKVECDRCGKQWTPRPNESNTERCEIGFALPQAPDIPPGLFGRTGWISRPRITDAFDFCQDCARAIFKFATVFPEGIDSEPTNPETDSSTSAG